MQRRYTVIYAYNSSAWDAITMSVARVFAEKRVCVKWWWCAYCRIQLFSTSRSFFNAADATAPSQSVQHVPKAPESHESPSFLHDPVAKKFINCMMWDGKKTLSQRLFKETLEIVKQTQLSRYKSGEKEAILDPLALFHKAIENSKPIMGTTGVRRGGKLFHVPTALPAKRQQFLAMKWLIHAARDRNGNGMPKKLAAEFLDAFNNEGTVIKKKQDLHRLAEANRAFAHFRW